MICVSLWIRIYLLELNYLFKGVKDVMNTQWYNDFLIMYENETSSTTRLIFLVF